MTKYTKTMDRARKLDRDYFGLCDLELASRSVWHTESEMIDEIMIHFLAMEVMFVQVTGRDLRLEIASRLSNPSTSKDLLLNVEDIISMVRRCYALPRA